MKTNKNTLIRGVKKIVGSAFLVSMLAPLISSAQTQTIVTGKAPISLETPKGWNKNKKLSKSVVYNAPQNCVILDYSLTRHHLNGAHSIGVDFVAAGSRFISHQEVNTAFSNALDLAVDLGIQGQDLLDLQVEFNQLQSHYESMQNLIESSHASIQHSATIWGKGAFNGRSWYFGSLNVTLLCCDAEHCSKQQMENKLYALVRDKAPTPVVVDGGGKGAIIGGI